MRGDGRMAALFQRPAAPQPCWASTSTCLKSWPSVRAGGCSC